ncbi:MAG: ZIP family metal transporter [Dehalococcoidales bacterium]|nr:ZIP family metal transporter [Dehalococcoidales bacterium]
MNTWLYAIPSVILVSLISLIGVFTLALGQDKLKKVTFILVSFAVGGLLGGAFVHLIPEAFEELGINLLSALYIVIGMLIFFILEKFIRWRHCHIPTSAEHVHPIVTMNLIGDGVHNFLDGLMIGASYIVGIPVGIATTLAVVLHEIPQEIGDFGILIHGGFTVKKALIFNLLSALTAVLGTVISLVVGPHVHGYTSVLLPITAGGFLYIASADLIPELQRDVQVSKSLLQFALIVAGIGIMALLVLIE